MSLEVIPTPLPGVMVLQPTQARDARGSFIRLSCVPTLARAGITFTKAQTSLSRSALKGTLRGLHFQRMPAAETKIVHCVIGRIFDVTLDLRPGSPTFGKDFTIELSAEDGRGILIPAGCAHGVLTQEDDTAVLYEIDEPYDPACATGVRWNDPAFTISWPAAPRVISDRDASWPDFGG